MGKLNVLLDDFGLHFMMAKEQYESQFTDDNIIEAIAENEKNGMPIPYIKFPALKTKKGEKKLPKNVIDKEKLLYPYDFYTAYQFKHFLNDRIKEAEKIKIIPKQKNELEPEIFDNSIPKEKSDFILKMLEDVGITTNGKTKLGRKGAYHIRAVVEAAIEKNILPKRILHFTKLICDKIDHPISSKLARSKDFDSLVRRYKVYIDANYKTTLAE
ncbi:MAG: hypothetical protein IPJ93_02475 [Bacteroidota bacterium]|nr:MAG: hypothetical protein IPJ93_02475 [Bacteroidota bacterium]